MTTSGIYQTIESALRDAAIWNQAASNGSTNDRVARRARYYTVRALRAAAEMS